MRSLLLLVLCPLVLFSSCVTININAPPTEEKTEEVKEAEEKTEEVETEEERKQFPVLEVIGIVLGLGFAAFTVYMIVDMYIEDTHGVEEPSPF